MATKTKNTPATVTTTGLALTPENVTSTIDSLKKQLEELKANISEAVSTNIEYTFGNGHSTNIKDVTTLGELMEISSSIEARSSAFEKSITRHNLVGKIKPFSHNNKSFAQWMEIIDKAAFELINKVKITQIEAAIKKLSKFEDEKIQLQREFADIVGSATELLS
jgi:hypothetical protein